MIDYYLVSPHFFQEMDAFEVEELNPILFDIYCILSLELKSHIFENENLESNIKHMVKIDKMEL